MQVYSINRLPSNLQPLRVKFPHVWNVKFTNRYANRAKNIKNKAKINEDPKDALLREFQKEIERLKAQLVEGKFS